MKSGLQDRLEILERACGEPVTLESLIAFDGPGNMMWLTDQRIRLAFLDDLGAE